MTDNPFEQLYFIWPAHYTHFPAPVHRDSVVYSKGGKNARAGSLIQEAHQFSRR